jgi:hypothetical protein
VMHGKCLFQNEDDDDSSHRRLGTGEYCKYLYLLAIYEAPQLCQYDW